MPHEVGQGRTGGEKAGEVAAGRGLVIKANFFSLEWQQIPCWQGFDQSTATLTRSVQARY